MANSKYYIHGWNSITGAYWLIDILPNGDRLSQAMLYYGSIYIEKDQVEVSWEKGTDWFEEDNHYQVYRWDEL